MMFKPGDIVTPEDRKWRWNANGRADLNKQIYRGMVCTVLEVRDQIGLVKLSGLDRYWFADRWKLHTQHYVNKLIKEYYEKEC